MADLSQIFLPVQRIIPFSNVEGSGNRTSIFLQGCNINCLYCHNPETIPMTSPTARIFSLEQLLHEIRASMPFIRGITVSGGEPTIHAKELTILFQEVHDLGLTCYLDSNGFFPYEEILPLIAETDRFLFDIKGMGEGLAPLCLAARRAAGGFEEARPDMAESRSVSLPLLSERREAENLTGNAGEEIFSRPWENLRRLLLLGKVEEVRLVYIKGFYEEKDIIRQIANCLRDYPEVLFKLIRVHAKGARSPKHIAQNMPMRQEAEALAAFAEELGLYKQQLIL